ncbi:DUF2269 domain-containing protein [Cryptosporangium minutisporangium]|uniref:DUF2269 domain-containing protein n=1 Tax=Cryptosporangium minutisporangium TaxID=113569 RepID=A0ABP6T2T7_9ACTN
MALVAHVGTSVGWLGAVLVSLVLGVVGLCSTDPVVTRSVYVTLESMGWWTLVPLSLASLGTGLIQSAGTQWGLVRHYWVIFKLLINLLAVAVLLLYMQTLEHLGQLARDAPDPAGLEQLRTPSPSIHAAAAMLLLTTALVLSVYKPRGLTPWAARPARTDSPSLRAEHGQSEPR